ncbi:hypothetical protein Patl1_29979 [Pistacia atlantica]|uniref:Uncharacterized protein n=1 Tax=Pistacia atlantica TaxID=434234 RepID=A0ACC1AA62_9ROSI|nr:hypothetical protein Patl1_29979 [Pistacia atlantica]
MELQVSQIMESLSLNQLISATNRRNPLKPFHLSTRKPSLHLQTRPLRFKTSIRSKQSDYQDFQGYAKPSRLLPATEVKVCTETSLKRIISSFNVSGSQSLFKVKIETSNIYGSSLSDLNAGILFCVIDENGNSILQRIPPSWVTDHSAKTKDSVDSNIVHFQRGSSDEFTFEGPRLGKVEALWISLESGQWRLGGVSLTVINASQPLPKEDDGEEIKYTVYCYDFEVDDILLGEGGDASMVEIRPFNITELSGVDPFTLLSKSLWQSTPLLSGGISNEESMKEYAVLKFSLLLYDAILIFIGTSIASFSVGESSAFAFLIGGVSGFLYLLLLQRSIDGLPAPALRSNNPGGNFYTGFKGPLSSLALAIGFSLLAIKYSAGDDIPFMLTPRELLFGMMGFLACKVAVVLAAFKPVPVNLKENS